MKGVAMLNVRIEKRSTKKIGMIGDDVGWCFQGPLHIYEDGKGSTNVKDTLGHDITKNVATMAESQVKSILHPYDYIAEDTTRLKKIVIGKSRNANFCSFKKGTLQNFVIDGIDKYM
jgi:hypothetical protein